MRVGIATANPRPGQLKISGRGLIEGRSDRSGALRIAATAVASTCFVNPVKILPSNSLEKRTRAGCIVITDTPDSRTPSSSRRHPFFDSGVQEVGSNHVSGSHHPGSYFFLIWRRRTCQEVEGTHIRVFSGPSLTFFPIRLL